MTQLPMHVPAVTQVPRCRAQVTLLRSSPFMTTAQTPVPAFHMRSAVAWHDAWVLLIRSLQTPLVVHEPAAVVQAAELAATMRSARHSGRVGCVASGLQLP